TSSGTHMGKVIEQLGIADTMAKKVIHRPALEGGVQLVAQGQAEIGIYPASEVASVHGISVVGPLPAGVDFNILYGGAATANSVAGGAAAGVVEIIVAPEKSNS